MAGLKNLYQSSTSLPKENKERQLQWSEKHFFWLTDYVVCLWWSSVLTRFYILTRMTKIIDVGHGECSDGQPAPFPEFWNNWSTLTPGKTQSQFLITRRHSFLPQHFLPMHQIASRFFNAWPLLKSTEKKQGWFEMQIPAVTNKHRPHPHAWQLCHDTQFPSQRRLTERCCPTLNKPHDSSS